MGEVRSTSAVDGVVTARMAIDPDKAEMIPSNTTARLLPKTLFGERYVALMMPEKNSASPVVDGTVLRQDVSGNAIEVGQLLDNLLPLLEAIPPQDLANTLGALSQGLDGRGAELGLTIDRLENIFAGLNTELPNIQQGLRGLADFSQTYADAGPQLIEALDNLSVTGNTFVEQRPAVDTLIGSLTATSASTADFLEVNADNLIRISADSREALELLAQYSPAFGCTFSQFVPIVERAQTVIGVGEEYQGINVHMPVVNPKGRYLPNQDEPRLFDDRGPRCYTPADTEAGEFFPQYPGGSPTIVDRAATHRPTPRRGSSSRSTREARPTTAPTRFPRATPVRRTSRSFRRRSTRQFPGRWWVRPVARHQRATRFGLRT
ncbi:hypothetical protein BJF84_25335 [Rhodococcus sp. CUA-806]|nr:hypothetical protein BJF84_25335 [Rhodococcus sp. CUA-806]